MSSWEVKTNFVLDKQDEMRNRLANLPSLLEDVAQQIKDAAVQNIEQKHIIDTGWLRDHVDYKMQDDGFILSDFDTSYGIYNEFGTRRGMIARPFMTPAAEMFGSLCDQTFVELIK